MGYDIKWGVCERVWVSRCVTVLRVRVGPGNRHGDSATVTVRLGLPTPWLSLRPGCPARGPGRGRSEPTPGHVTVTASVLAAVSH